MVIGTSQAFVVYFFEFIFYKNKRVIKTNVLEAELVKPGKKKINFSEKGQNGILPQ